jgi:hypothetical protein
VPKSEDRVLSIITEQLESTGLNVYYQREIYDANEKVGKSLKSNPSKTGGGGGGIPDITLLFRHEDEPWVVFIENKNSKEKMGKYGSSGFIDNRKKDGELSYKQVISKYALNGACYYAQNSYRDTDIENYLVIGVCGNEDSTKEYNVDISVYVITAETNGEAVKYNDFQDFAFLGKDNFYDTMKAVKESHLSDIQREELLAKSEKSIDDKLTNLNQKMRDDYNIDAKWRINMVVAMILAGMGDKNAGITPLRTDELKGSSEDGNTDADIIVRKIKNLLAKRSLPQDKQEHIVLEITRTTKLNTNFNEPDESGETINKKLYNEIQSEILPFVENRLLDFAGIVYNKVTDWMGLADDEKNDVVLTPRYIVDLMVKLTRVNRDSYVWDFALGSGGFLISSMNEMLKDARNNESSLVDGLKNKERHIKEKQLLGIEKRSDIQMLAILNMLLVGDGSSNILNTDSLTKFEGNYSYPKNTEKFPADVFLLNPPYSAEGNGMIFVKRALNMMKTGYAAVIIQDSAGSGRATEINKKILEKNALIASIKMPIDIFIGKSSVQTSIYVFTVGKKHDEKQMVKFIDFRNDGYARSNRRKSGNDVNLRDVDNAKGRYAEVVDLILYGRSYLDIFTEEEYVEGTINPKNGADWNFDQHKKIDTKPTLSDFKKTVAEYLAWEVSNILKGQAGEEAKLGKK